MSHSIEDDETFVWPMENETDTHESASSPQPSTSPSPSSSTSATFDSPSVGLFIRDLTESPDLLMSGDHRFLRQQILAAADVINARTAAMRLKNQKRQFRDHCEKVRVSEDVLPPPSDAMCQASRPMLLMAGDGTSTSLSTATDSSKSVITVHSMTSTLAERKRVVATLKDPNDRVQKPHIADMHQHNPNTLNRHQLNDASLTLRQLKHLGANRCYVCKLPLPSNEPQLRHQFFTNHCITCGDENAQKRHILHDLSGKIAVVTGARIKIGFLVGLKLLRCGATLIATSRFPVNTLMRYQQEPDFHVWKDKLHILYADLCNPEEVQGLADRIKKMVPHVDILINNAAQTVRRPLPYYEQLNRIERASQSKLLSLMTDEQKALLHAQLTEGTSNDNQSQPCLNSDEPAKADIDSREEKSLSSPVEVKNEEVDDEIDIPASSPSSTAPSLHSSSSTFAPTSRHVGLVRPSSGSSSILSSTSSSVSLVRAAAICGTGLIELPRSSFTPFSLIPSLDHMSKSESSALFPPGKVDTTNDYEPLDLRSGNSWNAKSDEVDPRELAEVLSTNAMAPFMLSTALKGWMKKSPHPHRYLILVSSMEGKLNRCKQDMHAHTNMAKAALNALTRTISTEYALDCIYVNSVDTGWNSEERAVNDPHRDPTFETPLDCADGAARILDPIFQGETNQRFIFGQFLKDYAPTEW